MADMNVAYSPEHGLGEEQSIWFKLTPLLNQENPMQVLMALSDKYGGVIPINLKNQRVVLLSEPAHAERVLVSNADNYTKYFDGLRPIFGKSMITVDGALWQKIRAPQQPAFHPNMFEVYFPYLMEAIRSKMARWKKFSETGETVEMVEETWTLAADMVCKALFDREMPFNPHFVFKQVKTYTDVMNHKSIRLKNVRGELEEITEESAAQAMKVWGSIPDTVIGAGVLEHREKTLYRMCGERDPEWNEVQQLSYTRMVIQETMRLFPPIWALIRIAAGDDEIGGHKIKAGDKVVILTYIAHHSPKYWEEPETFDPERFAPERAKKRVKYSYLPFAAGKRACIGGALSQIENTLALVQLVRKFTPDYVGPQPAKIHATVTLCPKGGLPFKIRELS
jgi:cytochrome P450